MLTAELDVKLSKVIQKLISEERAIHVYRLHCELSELWPEYKNTLQEHDCHECINRLLERIDQQNVISIITKDYFKIEGNEFKISNVINFSISNFFLNFLFNFSIFISNDF